MNGDVGRPESPGSGSAAGAMSSETSAGDWYAVYVKRHLESQVQRHLSQRRVSAFLPLLEVVRRGRERRPVPALEPLFPGYLFVWMEPIRLNPQAWHAVCWSPGVRYVLGGEGEPMPVPGEAVQAMQNRVKELGFVRPASRLVRGDRVRFIRGPLAGLDAIFDLPLSRAGRVRVLLKLMGQPRVVEADTLDLESV